MKDLEIQPFDALEIRSTVERFDRTVYYADRPIDFATWLDLAQTIDSELVQGVMIHRMAAQYPHEWIFMWLALVVGNYVQAKNLGKILGSRSAVKINNIGGRLPDLLFVRADNESIIHNDAIYGAPDLVIEIISPNDRPSDLIPLEADYRAIGVGEIVFIDPRKKWVRYLRKADTDYDEEFLTDGQLTLTCMPGFAIEVGWIFADDKPNAFLITQQLLQNHA
ncbi:MAG: Uma2 family endonuclease [Armatimonadetes bacterium]|nr:Uma2 family endonuclease [Armatimonadota bacterium]